MIVYVFTKDRPLQLCAYLESLFHYTPAQEKDVIVQAYNLEGYNELKLQFPEVTWLHDDGNFENILRRVVSELHDEDWLLWGCDDVVWLRKVPAEQWGHTWEDVLGVSYLLGTQLGGIPPLRNDLCDEEFIFWDWPGTCKSRWGYPWSLSATAYPVKTCKKVLDLIGAKTLKCPNNFERGGQIVSKNYGWMQELPFGCLNRPSSAVNLALNRVQDYVRNEIKADDTWNQQELIGDWDRGLKLDWKKMENWIPPKMVMGDEMASLRR